MLDRFGVTAQTWRAAVAQDPHFAVSETPTYVGRAVAALAVAALAVAALAVAALAVDPDAAQWNGRSLSSGQLARVYGFTDLDGGRPDCARYYDEIVATGNPPDPTGYR